MASVSKLVRDAVYARLTAAWATKLAGVVAGYTGVPTADKTLLANIDWAGTTKKQVFQGQVNIDSLDNTTTGSWPLVIIFVSSIRHDGEEKFAHFSGSVDINIEFHYTWRKSAALPNFDEFQDLIEDAFTEVFHDKAWIGALSGMTYKGQLASQRGAVQESGENWAQAVSYSMTFGVDV